MSEHLRRSVPAPDSHGLRVVVAGEATPGRHAVSLAEALADSGHDVTLLAWYDDGPDAPQPVDRPGLPADLAVADEDCRLPVRVMPGLVRGRPDLWLALGRQLRGYDAVVVADVEPSHLGGYAVMTAGLRRRRVPVVVAAPGLGAEPPDGRRQLALLRAVVGGAAGVIVPSSAESAARYLGASVVMAKATPGPDGSPRHGSGRGPAHLIILGVGNGHGRLGEGISALLSVLEEYPGVDVTAVVEPDHEAPLATAIDALGLHAHVGIVPLPEDETLLEVLLDDADAVAGPTGARRWRQVAAAHGLPVFVAPPGTAPGTPPRSWMRQGLARLQDGPGEASPRAVGPLDREWASYTAAIESVVAEHAAAGGAARTPRPVRRRTPRTDVRLPNLPGSDILPGLTRAESWAAAGALSSLRLVAASARPDGRELVVVDESGPASPIVRWLRMLGYGPVRADVTGSYSSPAALSLPRGGVDLLTRLHPSDPTGTELPEVLRKAAAVLRPGGVVVVTVMLRPSATGSLAGLDPASLKGMLAGAEEHGLTLLGDLDGPLLSWMSRLRGRGSAHGPVRRGVAAAGTTLRPAGEDETPVADVALARIALRRR